MYPTESSARIDPWLSTLYFQALFWLYGYGLARCKNRNASPGAIYTYYPKYVAYSALTAVSLRYGALPWYVYLSCYAGGSLLGAAFFNWDQDIPGCAWSIRAPDCKRLARDWPVVLGLCFVATLVLAVLVYSGYRVLYVEHWPLIDILALAGAWVFPPALYGVLYVGAGGNNNKPGYHVHHYFIALYLIFLLPFDTVEAHLVRSVACGVFAQGAYMAAMGTLLFPQALHTAHSGFFVSPSLRRSRRSMHFRKMASFAKAASPEREDTSDIL